MGGFDCIEEFFSVIIVHPYDITQNILKDFLCFFLLKSLKFDLSSAPS